MDKKITFEQIQEWLGSSDPEYEAIDTLKELVNGEYTIEAFKQDIKETLDI